jgi:carbamoyltransferase
VLILGLIDSKPSTAAILNGDKVVAAIAEERLCRMKMASGMPRQAIARVMQMAGVSGSDIDRVAVAQRISVFEPQPVPWSGWFNGDHQQKRTLGFDSIGSTLAPIAGRCPLAWKAHHLLKGLVFRERVQRLPELLKGEYAISAPVRFYDHHYCHATSAFFTSGFSQALVVTLDGGGDGLSGSVYVGKQGKLTRLSSIDSFNSLGNFYSYITALCGFKAERHEGKITGLAACGKPSYAAILRKFVQYREPGQIHYAIPMYHSSALRLLAEALPRDFGREDLAASAQLVLEEVGIAFIRYWLRRTGLHDVAAAGGVFGNVKFNQRVHELEEVNSILIHPAMDDSGLSVGGAIAAALEEPGAARPKFEQKLSDVYLGPAYHDDRVEKAIQETGFKVYFDPDICETIATLLAQGNVVARFFGRMEYGPRALGHRSILYQTTDPSVNDWLNQRLQRTEFMPFGPATLDRYADECYGGLQGAEDTARFMTITLNCTDKMKSQSPGVVHRDGTARPQIVDHETSPDFFRILTAYHRQTGIPSLINTSLNIHEEPIVCTPQDALRAFDQGNLDYLAINDWLIAHPSTERRQAKQGRKRLAIP